MSGKQPDRGEAAPGARHLTLAPALPGFLRPDGDPDGLHAWLDGELPPREAASVGRSLSRQPLLAARAAAYRAQVDELHALYDPVLEEPIPPQLLDVLARRRLAAHDHRQRKPRHRRRPNLLAYVAVAVTAAVLTGGAVLSLPL